MEDKWLDKKDMMLDLELKKKDKKNSRSNKKIRKLLYPQALSTDKR